METNFSHNDWYHIRIKLKQKYPQLTHSDLYPRGGADDNLIHLVAHKLQISNAEMREIIVQLG